MIQQLKNLEATLLLLVNAVAVVAVAGAVLSLINFIEVTSTFIGINPGFHLPEGVSLSIALALIATWKVNGRFVTRGD